jgi:hypothetical protein
MIKFLHNLALFRVKNANFLQNFSAKIFFKNYNIGPRMGEFSPILRLFLLKFVFFNLQK